MPGNKARPTPTPTPPRGSNLFGRRLKIHAINFRATRLDCHEMHFEEKSPARKQLPGEKKRLV